MKEHERFDDTIRDVAKFYRIHNDETALARSRMAIAKLVVREGKELAPLHAAATRIAVAAELDRAAARLDGMAEHASAKVLREAADGMRDGLRAAGVTVVECGKERGK